MTDFTPSFQDSRATPSRNGPTTVLALLLIICVVSSVMGCKPVTDLEGQFTVRSVLSDRLMGVASEAGNGNTSGAPLLQLNNLYQNATPQDVWVLHHQGDGYYRLVANSLGKALTVGNSAEPSEQLYLDTVNQSDNQLFRITHTYPTSSAEYTITSKVTESVLSVAGAAQHEGAALELQSNRMQREQQWIVTAYKPDLPERTLVTSSEAHDVFAEAGTPYVGPTYQQDFTRHNIHPASPLDPRTVAAGTMIPGRVIVNGKPFVEYYPGKLPFIAVCIHNKSAVTQQMRENYPKGWRECSANCDPLKAAIQFRDGKIGAAVGDSGSGELCKLTVDYLEKVTGLRPHMIVPNWPKGLLDMNRTPRNTVAHVKPPLRQHPDLLATWDDFMSFVREARDIAYQDWGGGLQIGFHGQVSRSARNHLGTGVTAGVLNVREDVMNNPSSKQYKTIMTSSRLKYSLKQRGLSPWQAYKGTYSLGQGIATRGIPTFPSATMLDQRGPFWSTGGSFERNTVSGNLQDRKIEGRPYPDHHPDHFDAIQLESYSNFMRGERLTAYAAQLGEAIYDNLVYNLGFNIPRVRGGIGAMTAAELEPVVDVATDCKGSPLKSTTAGQVGSHFHLPQACLQFCAQTPGCTHVSMYVDPSPDPGNKNYRKNRQCHAYKQCVPVTKSDYNVYRLLP